MNTLYCAISTAVLAITQCFHYSNAPFPVSTQKDNCKQLSMKFDSLV